MCIPVQVSFCSIFWLQNWQLCKDWQCFQHCYLWACAFLTLSKTLTLSEKKGKKRSKINLNLNPFRNLWSLNKKFWKKQYKHHYTMGREIFFGIKNDPKKHLIGSKKIRSKFILKLTCTVHRTGSGGLWYDWEWSWFILQYINQIFSFNLLKKKISWIWVSLPADCNMQGLVFVDKIWIIARRA